MLDLTIYFIQVISCSQVLIGKKPHLKNNNKKLHRQKNPHDKKEAEMSIWLCMPGGFVFEEILCGATSVNHLSLDPVDVMYCLSLSPVKPGRSSAQFSPDLFICRKFMENWSKHLEWYTSRIFKGFFVPEFFCNFWSSAHLGFTGEEMFPVHGDTSGRTERRVLFPSLCVKCDSVCTAAGAAIHFHKSAKQH